MYSTSTNHDAYNNKRRCFSSMRNKPLSPYDPNAHRSRLADRSFLVTLGNVSQIEIGDRYVKIIHVEIKKWPNIM